MPCRNCSCPSCLSLAGSPIPPTELPLPPSELMTTNRAPTDSEVAHSRNVIDSAKRKISLIQTAMNDLAEQTKDISHLIEIHRTSTSPLKTFPSELLVAIFTEYVNIVTDPWIIPAPPEPPLNLMWICSRWREIVLDTPQLWTKISSRTPMASLWVDRSKELPLDLKLDLSLGETLIFDILVPHAHRWERLDFNLRSRSDFIFKSPVKGHLRSLKVLKVSSAGNFAHMDFCEAPQLTEVWLENMFQSHVVKLPWEQLRDCTLSDSVIVLYALQHAKNIQTCRLDMCIPPWGSIPKTPPRFCCPSLNTLIIYWRPEDPYINEFFSSITLSSLQNLEIRLLPALGGSWSTDFHYLSELGPTLLKFFERSSSHLAALTLDDLPISSTQLIDYLTLMPSLISLDIKYEHSAHRIGNDFAEHLTLNHPNYPSLLPRLGALSLRGWVSFSEEYLYNLIASRRNINLQNVGAVLLAELVLDCFSSTDWSHCCKPPLFHQFVSEGLSITYGHDWDIGHPAMDMIKPARTW
ncbi:hypothetical protein BD779DRAFT_826122 [Infundibulicybe gibba]|nr:hypothetical protein BD779DRAFT_826122 [Infundibulicybe gibba]